MSMPRTPMDVHADLVSGLSAAKGEFVGVQLRDIRAVVDDKDIRSLLVTEHDDEVLFGPSTDEKKLVKNKAGNERMREKVTNVLVDREKLLARLTDEKWTCPSPVDERIAAFMARPKADEPAKQPTVPVGVNSHHHGDDVDDMS